MDARGRLRKLGTAWRKRWPVAALDVALLRIVVSLVVATTTEVNHALQIAAGSKAHLEAPTGLHWFVRWAPLDLTTASHVRTVHLGAAFLACVGLYARPSLAVLTATSFYLFALNQLGGAVLHDMHLLWFLVILALASPAEALSLDAWFATTDLPLRRRLFGDPTPRARHAVPMACVGTLFGLVYLFPGAWKLAEAGLGWALSDNVVNQMHAKWLQQGVVPTPRVDHAPWLVSAGALLAIGFELSFLVLVHLGPRIRLAALVAGLAFHLGIQHFLRIPFASLWLCYVGLVPWSRWRSSVHAEPVTAPAHRAQSTVLVALTALLVALLVERGVRGETQSYPVACYPTFQHRIGPSLQDLRILAQDANGSEREITLARDPHGHRTQAEWGLLWSLAGVYGTPFSAPRLIAYLRSDRRVVAELGTAKALRAELVLRATAPERWTEAPVLLRELATLPWHEAESPTEP